MKVGIGVCKIINKKLIINMIEVSGEGRACIPVGHNNVIHNNINFKPQ